MKAGFALCLFAATVALSGTVFGQTTVKVRGATTLEKIIKAKQADIEAKSGVKLEIVGNGAGRGLEDLATGAGDIAMVGGPFLVLSDVVNEKKPGTVKPAELKYEQLFTMPAAVITNPANTVGTLTEAQLKGILTGSIKSWKEVGGPDVPVVVVVAVPSDGVRATVQALLLKSDKFAADARTMQTAPDILKVVAQLPGSVGVVSTKNADASVKGIKTDSPIEVPFGVAVKADAKDPVPAVVAAIKELAKP